MIKYEKKDDGSHTIELEGMAAVAALGIVVLSCIGAFTCVSTIIGWIF